MIFRRIVGIFYALEKVEYKILDKMFEGEAPESVFEIGCGGAALLKDISDHFGGIKVGGIDISKVRMENAKNIFPDTEFLIHDLNDPWPVPDNSYDMVFSIGVMMYIFNPVPVIQEMLRVAKKGIILAEYHNDQLDEAGWLMKYILADQIETGIIRNYKKIFDKLGKEITMENFNNDKTIIKCLK